MLLDLTLNCFLHQHVNKPTRGEHILDLDSSSCESMVDNFFVHRQFSNRDHNFMTLDSSYDVSVTYLREFYHYFKRGSVKAMKA